MVILHSGLPMLLMLGQELLLNLSGKTRQALLFLSAIHYSPTAPFHCMRWRAIH